MKTHYEIFVDWWRNSLVRDYKITQHKKVDECSIIKIAKSGISLTGKPNYLTIGLGPNQISVIGIVNNFFIDVPLSPFNEGLNQLDKQLKNAQNNES